MKKLEFVYLIIFIFSICWAFMEFILGYNSCGFYQTMSNFHYCILPYLFRMSIALFASCLSLAIFGYKYFRVDKK